MGAAVVSRREFLLNLRSFITLMVVNIILTLLLTASFPPNNAIELTPEAKFIRIEGIPAKALEESATPYLLGAAGETDSLHTYLVGRETGSPSNSPVVSTAGNSLLTGL